MFARQTAALEFFLLRCHEPDRFLGTEQDLLAVLHAGGPSRIVTVNTFDLSVYATDPDYFASVNRAQFWCADGTPVVRALRATGLAVARVTGSDLAAHLVTPGRISGLSRVAVLGSAPHVVAAYGALLRAAGRDLVFHDCGHRNTWTPETIGPALAAARPDVLLLAVGTPLHGHVADTLALAVPCPLIGVGAALNMTVGHERRAPGLVQRIGAEWLWRLASDPKRLWRRYVVDCLPLLVPLLLAVRRVTVGGEQQ